MLSHPKMPFFSIRLWTSLPSFPATKRFRRYPSPYTFQRPSAAPTHLNASTAPSPIPLNGILDYATPALTHRSPPARRHHHFSGVHRPAAASITAPSENKVSSSHGRPINCRPSGRPSESSPAGTERPGRPAMFTVTVNTSLRYISIGSP